MSNKKETQYKPEEKSWADIFPTYTRFNEKQPFSPVLLGVDRIDQKITDSPLETGRMLQNHPLSPEKVGMIHPETLSDFPYQSGVFKLPEDKGIYTQQTASIDGTHYHLLLTSHLTKEGHEAYGYTFFFDTYQNYWQDYEGHQNITPSDKPDIITICNVLQKIDSQFVADQYESNGKIIDQLRKMYVDSRCTDLDPQQKLEVINTLAETVSHLTNNSDEIMTTSILALNFLFQQTERTDVRDNYSEELHEKTKCNLWMTLRDTISWANRSPYTPHAAEIGNIILNQFLSDETDY